MTSPSSNRVKYLLRLARKDAVNAQEALYEIDLTDGMRRDLNRILAEVSELMDEIDVLIAQD